MGGGSYSYSGSVDRRVRRGFASHSVAKAAGADMKRYRAKAINEVFTRDDVMPEMQSVGIKVREARDSEEHPNSFPIIIGLDVTGSMQNVPYQLLTEGFPKLMDKIIQSGVADPQVLFLAIGDHNYDQAPLQAGQFESSDELLEKWLQGIYLEGGGGGNAGESYSLAWYFAANHTATDSWEKRHKKGLLFTIGDEPPLHDFPKDAIQEIMGEGAQASDETDKKLLEAVQEKWEVFHVHVLETMRGKQADGPREWKKLLGGNLLSSQHHDDVANIISDTILKHYTRTPGDTAGAEPGEAPEQML